MYSGNTQAVVQSRPAACAADASFSDGRAEGRITDRRCLVVDDDATIMRLVAQMLESVGYQADTAENGASACNKFPEEHYDLVVTDLDMPGMDGHCLAARIKESSRDTRIVIMTRRCQAEVGDIMHSAVADAWLFKPFGWNELFSAINVYEAFLKRKPRGNSVHIAVTAASG